MEKERYLLVFQETEESNPIYRYFKSMKDLEYYVEQITTYNGYCIYELICMA